MIFQYFEKSRDEECIGLESLVRVISGGWDKRHCGEVIDFVRAEETCPPDDVLFFNEFYLFQDDGILYGCQIGGVVVLFQKTEDFIPFLNEEFGEIRPVLPGDSGNDGAAVLANPFNHFDLPSSHRFPG